MTNEFSTLNLECSNLVPQGPGYENITLENQVCAVVGAVPGQTTVNGLRYLKLSYDHEWDHIWRVREHHEFDASGSYFSYLLVTRISPSLPRSV